jgi:hypothetical protein
MRGIGIAHSCVDQRSSKMSLRRYSVDYAGFRLMHIHLSV